MSCPTSSQLAIVKQRIGLTDVTITYHRPLVNGRKIWGGVVPLGEVWRAGANENTTIKFSDAVSVEGQPLAKGTYGLHMIPTADSWTVIFSKMSSAWGSYTYKQEEDALRVNVKPRQTAEMEEALEFEFEDLKPDSAMVTMKWEKIAVAFKVAINDAETTMANIRNQMRGRAQYEWESLNQAAQFCLNEEDQSRGGVEVGRRIDSKRGAVRKPDDQGRSAQGDRTSLMRPRRSGIRRSRRRRRCSSIPTDAGCNSTRRTPKRWRSSRKWRNVIQTTVQGHLANARIKSAAGDFAGAAADATKAQAAAVNEQQKKNIKVLIDRLQAKQDINK